MDGLFPHCPVFGLLIHFTTTSFLPDSELQLGLWICECVLRVISVCITVLRCNWVRSASTADIGAVWKSRATGQIGRNAGSLGYFELPVVTHHWRPLPQPLSPAPLSCLPAWVCPISLFARVPYKEIEQTNQPNTKLFSFSIWQRAKEYVKQKVCVSLSHPLSLSEVKLLRVRCSWSNLAQR